MLSMYGPSDLRVLHCRGRFQPTRERPLGGHSIRATRDRASRGWARSAPGLSSGRCMIIWIDFLPYDARNVDLETDRPEETRSDPGGPPEAVARASPSRGETRRTLAMVG